MASRGGLDTPRSSRFWVSKIANCFAGTLPPWYAFKLSSVGVWWRFGTGYCFSKA